MMEILVGGDDECVNNFVKFVKLGIDNKNNRPLRADIKSIEVDDEDYKGNIRTTESFSRWLDLVEGTR